MQFNDCNKFQERKNLKEEELTLKKERVERRKLRAEEKKKLKEKKKKDKKVAPLACPSPLSGLWPLLSCVYNVSFSLQILRFNLVDCLLTIKSKTVLIFGFYCINFSA